MLKHQPFGYTKSKLNKHFNSILEVTNKGCIFADGSVILFDEIYKSNTFADGKQFGIKET